MAREKAAVSEGARHDPQTIADSFAVTGQERGRRMTLAHQRGWAVLFARLVLGLIFFMAGIGKVFQLGPLEHARKYFLPFADTFLPVWSLWFVGVTIPFVELIGG